MAPCALNPYYNFDYWAKMTPESPDTVELTVFMPNGILLILKTSWTATLAEVKEVSKKVEEVNEPFLFV